MAALKFASSHNMVAFLDKPTESDGFEQIVDFLNAHPIKYALTVNPTIYTACIEQLWATAKVKTINEEVQIQALVDKKKGHTFISNHDYSSIRIRGEGSEIPTDSHHTPTTTQPSTSKPQKKQSRRKQRKGTEVSQPSGPTKPMTDETENVESVPTHSNDPLLSGEDRLKLNELMELNTSLSKRVIDLEKTKTSQAAEITELKERVKKLEKKKGSKTYKLKRLYKVGRSARVVSSEDKGILDGEEVFVNHQNPTSMAALKFASSHNMQFWATAKVKTVNGEVQIQALVDKKKVIITETSVRSDLQLEDAEGTECLPNATIFEQLTLMGYENLTQKLTFYKAFFSPQWKFLIHTILQCLSAKTTAWNEFSSTMASAVICLATNQKFNFSKYIFDNMVKNLEVFLDKQVEGMSKHKEIYVTPSHTKKVFANMQMQRKDFSGRDTPLFPTMIVQAQEQEQVGEGSEIPTDSHHTPTNTQPSTSKPSEKQIKKEKQRKEH
ncbi:hypothetical protein Tco_0763586 [Tanacetum coccineum]